MHKDYNIKMVAIVFLWGVGLCSFAYGSLWVLVKLSVK